MKIENGYIKLPVYFANTNEDDGIPSTETAYFDVIKFVDLYFYSNPHTDDDKTTVHFDNGDSMAIHLPFTQFLEIFQKMREYSKSQINVRMN